MVILTMNKLPENIRSLISASNQLNNQNRVVEELVYNALDAEATSLAIRISIDNNWLQVIDNGCGILKKDLRYIGESYMTSKFRDISTLNCAPTKYGFRGQFLANVINVSRYVEVSSRHEKSEETYVKIFENGKEKHIQKSSSTRPSKGTTVEIKGFLYNLDIKKNMKNTLGDLQIIKTFLEHISLTESNISISLRDDSKNEIVFKIHKHRDINQTLSTLYNINKEDMQELQVEKNAYKIKAILGKSDEGCNKHVIYLNGKCISVNSKLHEIVNFYMKRHLHITYKNRRICKIKRFNEDHEVSMIKNKIPYYFIFITCPYMDYTLSSTDSQSVLEFKDWGQIKNLVEKLIKFFTGDLHLKEIKTNTEVKTKVSETREEVKKIMERILGAHSKKPGEGLIQKGIKGKNIKRKLRKQSLGKLLILKVNHNTSKKKNAINLHHEAACRNDDGDKLSVKENSYRVSTHINYNEGSLKVKKTYFKPTIDSKSCLRTKIGKKDNSKFKKVSNYTGFNHKDKQKLANKNGKLIKSKLLNERLIEKKSRKKPKIHVSSNKNLQQGFYNKNKITRHDIQDREKVSFKGGNSSYKNVSIQNNGSKAVMKSNSRKPNKSNNRYTIVEKAQNRFQSNYDLLNTVLKCQNDNNVGRFFLTDEPETAFEKSTQWNIKDNLISAMNLEITNYSNDPLVTYESHQYYVNNNYFHDQSINESYLNIHKIPRKFITEQSRENFNNYNNISYTKICNNYSKPTHVRKVFNEGSSKKHHIVSKIAESSYTIEFTKRSNLSMQAYGMNIEENRIGSLHYTDCNDHNNETMHINTTYTVKRTSHKRFSRNHDNLHKYSSYSLEDYGNSLVNKNNITPNYEQKNNCKNYIFISKENNYENLQITDPMDVCETILSSQNVSSKEFEFSPNIIPNNSFQKNLYGIRCISHAINAPIKEATRDLNTKINIDHERSNYETDSIIEVAGLTNLAKDQYIERNIEKNIETENQSYISESVFESQPVNIGLKKQQNVLNPIINLDINEREPHEDTNIMFNLKNRPCFIPKGMSPILENCCTRNLCEYNLTDEYYEDEMYNEFIDNVRNNVDVFEPKIKKALQDTTNVLHKVNTKLNKANSSLKFNGTSLNKATVLGQVDEKFITAIIRDDGSKENPSECLVLFDQHAVHERIRLENNLSEYLIENAWVSVKIEEFSLKISRDEALFLHNYKNKFEQLGLRWDTLNGCEMSITAMPAALLGKHFREVEKYITAVKNLITEEINTIKMQSGCTSLYPKSIMDLVFSEACRYAIKFGEKLSMSRCVELLTALSECKTPFQCAHGRPVMAVIMEIHPSNSSYGVNVNKIKEWKAKYERFLKYN